MVAMTKLIIDLEFLLEMEELRKKGLTEEEIQGYFEFYAESWVDIQNEKDKKTYAN